MSYKAKKHTSYGYNRRSGAKPKFKMKKTQKKEIFGLTVSKNTEETVCSHPPSEIDEEDKTSISGGVGNQIGNVSGSLAKERRRKTKFPKSTDYT
jgi:hypothetical protein